MSKTGHSVIYTPGGLTLLDYEQNSCMTSIRISANQILFKRRVDYEAYKGNTASRQVRFTLCGLELSNSFEAMSVVLSLVKVFERRQFGTGDKNLTMRFPTPRDDTLQIFCALEPYKKSYEGLRLGWISHKEGSPVQKAHSLYMSILFFCFSSASVFPCFRVSIFPRFYASMFLCFSVSDFE